jgi:cell division protein FtsB
LFVLFLILNQHGLYRLYKLRDEQARLEQQIQALRERSEELGMEKANLEDNLEYIERLAREKYRMVKRGEKVFRVIENDRRPQPMETTTPD